MVQGGFELDWENCLSFSRHFLLDLANRIKYGTISELFIATLGA